MRANAEVIPLIRDVELPELDPDAVRVGRLGRDRKCATCSRSSSSAALIERLLEAFGADGRGGAAAATPSPVAAPQRHDRRRASPRLADAAGCCRAGAAAHGRRGRRRRVGGPARAQPAGRTRAVRARRHRRGVAGSRPRCSPTPGRRDAQRTVRGTEHRSPPRTRKRCCGRCCRSASTSTALASTPRSPRIWSTRRSPPTTSTSWCCATSASRSTPPRAASSQGQLLLDDTAPSVADVAGKRAVALARLDRTARRRARSARPHQALRRDRTAAGAGAGAHGGRRHRRRPRVAARPHHVADQRSAASSKPRSTNSPAGRSRSTAPRSCARCCSTSSALNPSKKTKTGFSTDAAVAREARRPAPDHRQALAVAGSREAAQHLRRVAGGTRSPRTGASTRRSTRPSPAPAACRASHRTCTTSRCAATRVASSAAPSCPPRAVGCSWPTTTRSSCASSPICQRDPGLTDAFTNGDDIHATTAARIYGVEPGDVTVGAAVQGQDGLLRPGLRHGVLRPRPAPGIPVDEASVILNAYFDAFPAVKAYMDNIGRRARDRGYTETLFGRRRPIPELSSPNFRIRQAGERQAMNAGIQGLAADIFKVALVALDQRLEADGLTARRRPAGARRDRPRSAEARKRRPPRRRRSTRCAAPRNSTCRSRSTSAGAKTWADAK